MVKCERLFQPITIGNLELKNRIVMLAMGVGGLEADNSIGDRYVNYFVERAKGGAALIFISCLSADSDLPLSAGLFHDRFLPGSRRLVDAVHAHGAKIGAQLLNWYHWRVEEGGPLEVVGPSAVANRMIGVTPRPLTVNEIHQLVAEYGEAARRAQEVGFDAIEIHMGMGFILNRFLSPGTNLRTDEYGGSLENRLRISLEAIAKIQENVGKDFPLACRISADEFMEGGHTVDDTKAVAVLLEKAGIHFLDVEAGWEEAPTALVQNSVPRGDFAYLAEEMKKVVSIPVVAAYRINEPDIAEEILTEGKADLIGLARALNADAEFANKALEGRFDEIRCCIACCRCLDEIFPAMKEIGTPYCISCAVNPMAGREAEYAIKPAEKPQKVFVIGGGPAGMEAARVAALRGHQVTLCEKEGRLGGNLIAASVAPYKDDIAYLTRTLVKQVEKAGVDIRLNTEVTPELIEENKPDVVILAAGSLPIVQDVPGVDGDNVVMAVDLLTGHKKADWEKAVIIGGGMIGCEVAEFLADKGTKVTILEILKRAASDIGPTSRWVVLDRMRKAGINIVTLAQVTEITSGGVNALCNESTEFFPADVVVIATGMKPDDRLISELQGKVGALYSIGDCVQPRRIAEAMETGFKTALEI
ncbi:FAD-dependent oxidoreductase [Chloroflexota bacterium]